MLFDFHLHIARFFQNSMIIRSNKNSLVWLWWIRVIEEVVLQTIHFLEVSSHILIRSFCFFVRSSDVNSVPEYNLTWSDRMFHYAHRIRIRKHYYICTYKVSLLELREIYRKECLYKTLNLIWTYPKSACWVSPKPILSLSSFTRWAWLFDSRIVNLANCPTHQRNGFSWSFPTNLPMLSGTIKPFCSGNGITSSLNTVTV